MMALENCNAAISKAVGKELTDREKGAVARQAAALIKRLEAVKGADDPAAVEAALKSFGDDIKAQRIIQQRNAALNFRAVADKRQWRETIGAFKNNPAEGIKSFFQTSLADFKNSKNALTTKVGNEITYRMAAFTTDLEKAGLAKYAFSGTDDKNIGQAIWHLRQDVVDEKALSKFGKMAVDTARIITKHQEAMRIGLNKHGAWVGKNSDYIVSRGHDSFKIARAGGNSFGSDASFKAWRDDVVEKLDWNKSFDGEFAAKSGAERDERLKSLWSQFTNGIHLSFSDQPVGAGGYQNLGRKQSHMRELVFSNADNDISYQKAYSRGDSLAEAAMHGLHNGGRDMAIMREWGPNAKANLDKFVASWEHDLHAEGRTADAAKLRKEYAKQLKNTWPVLTGEIGHPGSEAAAEWNALARMVTMPAKLGNVLVSSLNDVAIRASALNHYGIADGTTADLARSLAGQVEGIGTGGPTQAMKDAAAEAGVLLEHVWLPSGNHIMEHVGLGKITKLNQIFNKWNGSSWWTNTVRTNVAATVGLRHFQFKDTAFAKLPEGMQRGFRQFGIDEAGWDIIRRSEARELDGGKKIISPAAITEMEPSEFASLSTMAEPTEAHLSRKRDELAANYRNLVGEMSNITGQGNLTTRAIMMQGTNPGTWNGELLRHFMFLKSFTINYMRNYLGREIYGYNAERMTFPQALKAMVTFQDGGKAFAGTSKLIATGAMFGYISNALTDMENGRVPDTNWTTAVPKALVRGGAFGIYSDFLLAQVRPDASFADRVANIAGPTIGTAANLGDIVLGTIAAAGSKEGFTEKKQETKARQLFQLAYGSLPGANLFYTKYVMDYLVLHNLADMIQPGYGKKVQKTLKENTGQSYLLPYSPQTP